MKFIRTPDGEFFNLARADWLRTDWNYHREGVEGTTGYCIEAAIHGRPAVLLVEFETEAEAKTELVALVRQINHA